MYIFSEIARHAHKDSLQDEQQRCLGGRTNQQFSEGFMKLSSFPASLCLLTVHCVSAISSFRLFNLGWHVCSKWEWFFSRVWDSSNGSKTPPSPHFSSPCWFMYIIKNYSCTKLWELNFAFAAQRRELVPCWDLEVLFLLF